MLRKDGQQKGEPQRASSDVGESGKGKPQEIQPESEHGM